MKSKVSILFAQFFALLTTVSCLLFSPVTKAEYRQATSIDDCLINTGFSEDFFASASEPKAIEVIHKFIACLNSLNQPIAPPILVARGFAYSLLPIEKDTPKPSEDFCKAATMGYITAQEFCAFHSQDESERYRWTLAAALNGSRSAQVDLSISAWHGSARQKYDHDFNNYLVQYLGCHPSMFEKVITFENEQDNSEYLYNKKNFAAERLRNISGCHADLSLQFLRSTDKKTLAQWEDRARKQLAVTLSNIREQIVLYPHLAKNCIIEP